MASWIKERNIIRCVARSLASWIKERNFIRCVARLCDLVDSLKNGVYSICTSTFVWPRELMEIDKLMQYKICLELNK